MRKRRKPKYWPDTNGVCWYVREARGEYISGPQGIALSFRDLTMSAREEFWVVTYTQKMREIDRYQAAIGTLTAALIHPREVFKPAVMDSAAFIITVHNHPSGVVWPSKQDLEQHKRLEEGGTLLGIEVRDMVIIGREGYYSHKEKEVMTWPVEEEQHV